MRTNPGGQIAPAEVIGRDGLIRQVWRRLEHQSVVLSAERRMGKTCLIKKMIAEAPQDKLPIYHDLEGVRTPLEFVEIIFHDVEGYLGRLQRTAERARRFLAQLGGTEISGLKLPEIAAPHWKTVLTSVVEDLVTNQDRTVILFWDEMPLMLHNIKQRINEDAAMEVLDALRSLRQMHPDLRMVFTGSIGLHNVITSLRKAGYANDPTNDMATIDVPALSPDDAFTLSWSLLDGESIRTNDHQAMARMIADSVNGIPYFIHHVIDQMVVHGGSMTAESVEAIVSECLAEPQDPWHLRYYRERLNTYYADAEQPFALNLLDALASSAQPLSFDDVFNRLKSALVTEDSEMARYVLVLLQRDHYILLHRDGTFGFRFPIIQRFWRLHRGLAS